MTEKSKKENTGSRIRGVLAPVITPFDATLAPDADRFVKHCRWLVQHQAGLALFGTNSEAASLSVAERLRLTDAVLEAGIPPTRLMPGTGACSITDAVTLTRHAVCAGAAGVLMVPPFFYKGISEDGLFAYYAEVIEQVGDTRLALYLYHIPQLSHVPITLSLIERLLHRYPHVVAGAKDSSGQWSNTQSMLANYAKEGFDVFPASEIFLSAGLQLGAAGCISATVNVNPVGIHDLYLGWDGPRAQALQAAANAIRNIFQRTAMIPAMKHVVSSGLNDDSWRRVRPPLDVIDRDAGASLCAELASVGFAPPSYVAL